MQSVGNNAVNQMLYVLTAAMNLRENYRLHVKVISMHTIKPPDEAAILHAADDCGYIITIEEHSIHGGLGEACAAVLFQSDKHVKFKIVAIPYEYIITGYQIDIFNHYGISEKGITETALKILKQ